MDVPYKANVAWLAVAAREQVLQAQIHPYSLTRPLLLAEVLYGSLGCLAATTARCHHNFRKRMVIFQLRRFHERQDQVSLDAGKSDFHHARNYGVQQFFRTSASTGSVTRIIPVHSELRFRLK